MGTIFAPDETSSAVKAPLLLQRMWRHPLVLFRGIARTVAFWRARTRQRRALSRLNTDQLRDIGVTHYDAKREAAKPFWRD